MGNLREICQNILAERLILSLRDFYQAKGKIIIPETIMFSNFELNYKDKKEFLSKVFEDITAPTYPQIPSFRFEEKGNMKEYLIQHPRKFKSLADVQRFFAPRLAEEFISIHFN